VAAEAPPRPRPGRRLHEQEWSTKIIAERRGNCRGGRGQEGHARRHDDRRRPRHRRTARRTSTSRYQINTFLIGGPRDHQAGFFRARSMRLLKHPDILKKALRGSRPGCFGPDVDARSDLSAGHAAHLHHADPERGAAAVGRRRRPMVSRRSRTRPSAGKYKLRKEHLSSTVLVMALHRDPSVWGPNPDKFRSGRISARRAEAKRPVNAWEAVRQRPARLYRTRLCDARGGRWRSAWSLQRFKLVDIHRYQMQAEGRRLTIKPDGFKIKVAAAQTTRSGGRGSPGRCRRFAAAASNAAAPQAAERVRATTRRCWCCYGSNLGTAEELATRRRRSRRGQRFLPPRPGAARRICRAKFAGAGRCADLLCFLQRRCPRQNATPVRQNGWAADLPKGCVRQGALRFVRLRQTATGRRPTSRFRASSTSSNWRRMARRQRLWPRRRRCPQRSRRPSSRNGLRPSARWRQRNSVWRRTSPAAPTMRRSTRSSRWRRPAVNTIVAARRRFADEGAAQFPNCRTRMAPHPFPTARPGHIEVQLPAGVQLPRPADHLSVGAAQRFRHWSTRVARRFGFFAGRPDPPAGPAEGPPCANCRSATAVSVGAPADRVRRNCSRIATRKQIQIMSEPHALPDDQPKHCWPMSATTMLRPSGYRNEVLGKTQIGISTCWRNIRPVNCRSMPISKCCRCWRRVIIRFSSSPSGDGLPLQRHGSESSRRPRVPGRGVYKGVCSNYLAGRRVNDTIHATIRETKAGFRLPDDAAVPVIMIGPRHRSGAVSGIPAGRRAAPQGAKAPAWVPRCCSSAAGIPSRTISTRTS